MENLDALLEKIRKDGVEAAQTEADAIVAKARKDAAEITAKAQTEAEATIARAQAEATLAAHGAEATIRQAARDVLLKLGQDIEALFVRTLGGVVDETLTPGPLVEKLVADAVAAYLGTGHIVLTAGADLVPALKARLAKQGEVTVETDAQMGTGFRVRLHGGRVEHDFSGEAITEALAALLRPQLAALPKD